MRPYDDDDTEQRAGETNDEALLREIRDQYSYFSDAWKDVREQRRIDMRYVCGDPWSELDKQARENTGRPAINHDELNQYINQAVNAARQNKRGIKVEPGGGDSSSEHTAELRQGLIRAIEYKSQAASCYITAYQAVLEGSYGFCRVSRQYVDDDSDDQEITIGAFLNPDAVLFDPDCKKPDWSDAKRVFVLDPLLKADFKDQFPTAKPVDFSVDDDVIRRDWIHDKTVLVAEYWRVETKRVKGRTGRMVDKKKVVQYITNGLEILERNEQPGTIIPIIPFIGLERWVDEGKGPQRRLGSLVRLARDPQLSLAFLCSQQMEEAGLTPKTPYLGYVGQFQTDREAWETATKIPRAYLQVDPMPDSANGALLPLPQRVPFTPNFQGYELAKDSCRRAIQAAMGISPLPTAAQRQNQKSGIALEKIQSEQAIGSFHFLDNFERSIQLCGRVIESWIPVTYGTERSVAIRDEDETHHVVRLNTAQPYMSENNEQEHYPVEEGDHDITITTGPSNDSQREAADEFLETLIGNMAQIPPPGTPQARLLGMAIRMRQLGPSGDAMADIVDPPQQKNGPPPEMQIQQLSRQVQQLHAYAGVIEQENQQLKQERAAKVLDNQMRLQVEQLKIEAQVATAEINTKAQVFQERYEFVSDVWKQLQDQAHERQQQASDQEHERQQQAAQQQAAATAQASDQQHAAEQQASDQQHATELQQNQPEPDQD